MPSVPITWFAWGCLVLGSAFALARVRQGFAHYLVHSARRNYQFALAVVAGLLSVAYVHGILGDGPRIIDATAYWLQAKAFSQGSYTLAPPGPLHSFAGRFLVVTPQGELAVLFPPGFAAVLALGVRLGVPLLVNPLLGSACALLTYRLGRVWYGETAARVGALLSVGCATLRYHSADTMSHLLSACLGLGVLLNVSNRETHRQTWPLALAGLCAGWLVATRPVTGLVFGLAGAVGCFALAPTRTLAARRFGIYCLAGLPGLALWLSYQWVTTGDAFGSTQALYYSRSDWPSDCFRLGFGATVGCQFEHGAFLANAQPNGYGLLQALAVTGRRLYLHNFDVANFPCFLLLSVLVLRRLPSRPTVAIGLIIVTHVGAYALFYFDGNYPGGGARFFAEILPLEHVLLGAALTTLRWEWTAPSALLVGFALWGAKAHTTLAEREGGRPMFEAEALRRAAVNHGLVFVNTDHGFNLGFDPNATPDDELLIARSRGDALDYALWTYWGKPPSHRYDFDPFRSGSLPTITPFEPKPTLEFVGGNLWPPLETRAGSASPTYDTPCPNKPALSLHSHADELVQDTRLQLWVGDVGNYRIELECSGLVEVEGWQMGPADTEVPGSCTRLTTQARRLEPGPLLITLRSRGRASVAALTLSPVPVSARLTHQD